MHICKQRLFCAACHPEDMEDFEAKMKGMSSMALISNGAGNLGLCSSNLGLFTQAGKLYPAHLLSCRTA